MKFDVDISDLTSVFLCVSGNSGILVLSRGNSVIVFCSVSEIEVSITPCKSFMKGLEG